jgi:putative addiction module killer protein/probable addiction module antidote protein
VDYKVRRATSFDSWLDGLTDKIATKAIVDRIVRIESGLLGDHKSVGTKVGELRIDVGQGYRLYYTIRERSVVHLLRGGSKKTQKADIRKAEAAVKAMDKARKDAGGKRVRERQAGYATESDEPIITDADITFEPFDAADYIRGDDDAQIYLLRNALASGHYAYIANALGAVARARGLSNLERATGIKRQTLNKSLSRKGNPTLATLVTVLGALGLRLEIVEDGQERQKCE